jgi:hypothetical protein
MDKVPLSNNTKGLMYGMVEGRQVMIQPGETVMVDAPHSTKTVEPPPPAPGTKASPLQELQSKPVAEIKEVLGALSEPELKELLALENAAATPRKTLVAEIENHILALKTGN